MDWNYYADLRQTQLALKLKFVKGRGYGTYNTKDLEKEHKEEAKGSGEREEEHEAPVFFVTHVNNILDSMFTIAECTSAISVFTTLIDCMRTSFAFLTLQGATSTQKNLHCDGVLLWRVS